MLGALGAIAVVIAVTAGALGVGAYKRFSREPAAQPSSGPTAAAPRVEPPPAIAPAGDEPRDEPSTPAQPSADPPLEPAADAPDPSAVRYTRLSVAGLGPQSEVEALLERARPAVVRCALTGRALHLAIDFIATTGGHITISGPATQRPSDDHGAAACVARAIQGAGPMRFNGWQTAIVELDLELPAR